MWLAAVRAVVCSRWVFDLNSPVQNCLKFSAVFGTTSANNCQHATQTTAPLGEHKPANTRAVAIECQQPSSECLSGGCGWCGADFYDDAACITATEVDVEEDDGVCGIGGCWMSSRHAR